MSTHSTDVSFCRRRDGKKAKIPVFASDTDSVERGAVAALGFDYYQLGRVTGKMAVRLLGGESPSAMPVGTLESLRVFGDDYATPDGTCIRDYIHVSDLAQAHLDAMSSLLAGHASSIFNCGYGHGFSVREVVAMAKQVSGVDFPVEETGRRAGDPAELIAGCDKIRQQLGWQPRLDDLETILSTAWAWEQKLEARGARRE